jgi:hypothetical protein
MPEIRPVTIEPVLLPAIGRIPEIRALPEAPPVTLQLGMPVVDMPGCVPVHPDAKLNPSLLKDDPGRVGAFCPHGQVPSFRPMDFTPNELVVVESDDPRGADDEGEGSESTPSELPAVPRLPESDEKTAEVKAEVEPKPFIEKVVDGLPTVEAVVTTTTIAVVATTSALVAKPLADMILKTIKPTVKKTMKAIAKLRGKTVPLESVWERRVSQRQRNLAVRTLRQALKP